MNTELYIMTLSVVITTLSIFILIYSRLQLSLEKARYNMEKSRIELDKLRESLEREKYGLDKKMMKTEDRWRELYHILLSSQKDIDNQKKKTDAPRVSMFFREMGLTIEDMRLDRELVFVLTPFHEDQWGVFDTIVKVCNRYGLKCYRGDEKIVKGEIFPHLLKKIVQARLIIANIDGRNPNVFYELGIAHAIDKPVILISKSERHLLFDVKSKSIIIFKNKKELEVKLKEAITRVSLDSS